MSLICPETLIIYRLIFPWIKDIGIPESEADHKEMASVF